ncbi:MAG: 1-acyl-sn-glycerol-3-phosphate acyltransferase, partial [Anaerolineae bacterium]|nr:1-acyl-sn-glycerol-3-phosphate acyltransferase [Anaerolineae bacterium]
MRTQEQLTIELQQSITDEILKAVGLQPTHWSRPLFHSVLNRGTYRFSALCAQFDSDINTFGVSTAVTNLASHFISGIRHYGSQYIPREGSLLVTSNHPGATDALAVISLLHRDDIKIVLSGVPFTKSLTNAQPHFIHVVSNPMQRSLVIRNIISHLKDGGAIFIFPTGHVTPDPKTSSESQVIWEDWSESIAFIMQHAGKTRLLPAVVSGVIEDRFLNSPLCKIRRVKWRQQILAEFMQIIWQMMRPTAPKNITPLVTFIEPVSGDALKTQFQFSNGQRRTFYHQAVLNCAVKGLKQ